LAGFAIHYNLRVRDRRRVKRAIVTFFVAVARANRLERLATAAAAVNSGMRAIYGNSVKRIVAISFSLSILYFVSAFVISGGLSSNWQRVKDLKTRIEIAADPVLYSKPASRSRAQEQVCHVRGERAVCQDKYNDAEAVDIRARILAFGAKYRALIAKEPAHTELVMLTLWDGTYLGRSWLAAISPLCFNILLDLTGVVLVMHIAGRLSAERRLSRMIPLALVVLVGSVMLSSLSVYSYGLVDRGDVWGLVAVLGFPLGALIAVTAAVGFIAASADSLAKGGERNWVGWLFTAALSLGMVVLGLGIALDSWGHLSRPQLPTIQMNQPATWFFYLIAAGTVLPTLIGSAFVLAVVLFGTFARALLFPTLTYVRTVLRMPAPLLVTLTAAPAVVFQTLVSTWSDIFRMLRLN
jgi:hypothetical protein